jgi:NAD-dependent dihydropyrimidine dehydrogenase PreA subunit
VGLGRIKVNVRVSDDCILCGDCVRYCPGDVFEIVSGKLVIREEGCIYCKGCEPLCPVRAIKVEAMDEGLRIISHSLLG